MKQKIIETVIRYVMGLILLGVGIWYLSSSIGGASLTYTSMDKFLVAIGAGDGNIAHTNGCFLCNYISDVFGMIGHGTELFWTGLMNHIWLVMVVGFGIFLLIYTIQYIFDAVKTTAVLDGKEKKIEFKPWFDKVWQQGLRILVAGAFLGVLGIGGTGTLRTISKITITPVMLVGTELAIAALPGINGAASCPTPQQETDDILNPIMQPFMCVVGTLNAVVLAAASGGFALMNYAWLGMGGGILTWLAGLALVIMFMIIGFNLFFQILTIISKLVFLIIFIPIFVAAMAFEKTWKMAGGIVNNAINKILIKSALQIVALTLKILLIYGTVDYVADAYFPGNGKPDGYTAIFPPLISQEIQNPDADTLYVINVFAECEGHATDPETKLVDKTKFLSCFEPKKNANPEAFAFMDNGWDFALLAIFLFWLYYFIVSPRIDEILGDTKDTTFDFGGWIKNMGKTAWKIPQNFFNSVAKHIGK